MDKRIILAFDTVIAKGTVSLWREKKEIAVVNGDTAKSASETLLSSISDTLSNSSVKTDEITDIALTNGPGSYTGIRIGIATALGLAAPSKCKIHQISTLELLAKSVTADEVVTTGVWAGRNEIAYQDFPNSDVNIGVLSIDSFFTKYENKQNKIILDEKSRQVIEDRYPMFKIMGLNCNSASLIGKIISNNPAQYHNNIPKPSYARSLFDG